MIITKHGYKRVKQRVGLPKRALSRHILKVLNQGKLLSRKGFKRFTVIYLDFIYIFSLSSKLEPIFITTYSAKNVLLPEK